MADTHDYTYRLVTMTPAPPGLCRVRQHDNGTTDSFAEGERVAMVAGLQCTDGTGGTWPTVVLLTPDELAPEVDGEYLELRGAPGVDAHLRQPGRVEQPRPRSCVVDVRRRRTTDHDHTGQPTHQDRPLPSLPGPPRPAQDTRCQPCRGTAGYTRHHKRACRSGGAADVGGDMGVHVSRRRRARLRSLRHWTPPLHPGRDQTTAESRGLRVSRSRHQDRLPAGSPLPGPLVQVLDGTNR